MVASSRLKKSYKWGPQCLILGSLLILIYINDLRKTTDDTKVVLFADDTAIIVTNYNQGGLKTALNKTLSDTISWLKANFLLLNFNKTYLEKKNKNYIDATLDINYFNKSIANGTYTKFLDLVTEDTRTWDNHTDLLISRLKSACYAITALKATLPRKALTFRRRNFLSNFSTLCI
jgi:hypothetical protein